MMGIGYYFPVYCSGNDFIDDLLMWKVAHLSMHFVPKSNIWNVSNLCQQLDIDFYHKLISG